MPMLPRFNIQNLLSTPSAARPAPFQTFTGAITKNGLQFVLREKTTRKWYQLNDQETATKFDGEAVKVTGTFDAVGHSYKEH